MPKITLKKVTKAIAREPVQSVGVGLLDVLEIAAKIGGATVLTGPEGGALVAAKEILGSPAAREMVGLAADATTIIANTSQLILQGSQASELGKVAVASQNLKIDLSRVASATEGVNTQQAIQAGHLKRIADSLENFLNPLRVRVTVTERPARGQQGQYQLTRENRTEYNCGAIFWQWKGQVVHLAFVTTTIGLYSPPLGIPVDDVQVVARDGVKLAVVKVPPKKK